MRSAAVAKKSLVYTCEHAGVATVRRSMAPRITYWCTLKLLEIAGNYGPKGGLFSPKADFHATCRRRS